MLEEVLLRLRAHGDKHIRASILGELNYRLSNRTCSRVDEDRLTLTEAAEVCDSIQRR
jgi:hypothetical protein